MCNVGIFSLLKTSTMTSRRQSLGHDRLEGLLHVLILELEPELPRSSRQHLLTVQDHRCSLAQERPQREPGHRQPVWPVGRLGDSLAQPIHRGGHRCRAVHHARVFLRLLQRANEELDEVVPVDPAHELLPAAERAAAVELEHGEDLGESAAALLEDDAGANHRRGGLAPRRFLLPVHAELGEEILAGAGLLAEPGGRLGRPVKSNRG
mmetsp:Transcript_5584/g.22821  ORF Transcript_5584/g.22821 Transcript_5584/m.22821 type:complete len:208 (+) Transcript_5584:794-1417(+)